MPFSPMRTNNRAAHGACQTRIVVRWAYSRALPGWCVQRLCQTIKCQTIENNDLNSFVGIKYYLEILILRENDG